MSTAISKQIGENPRLRTYLVWVPMLMARESHVKNGLRVMGDPGVAHYWDKHSTLVRGYMKPLGLRQLAWDVYMIYRPGVRWDGDLPPTPEFWMHQLPGADAPRLDPAEFARRLKADLDQPGSPGE